MPNDYFNPPNSIWPNGLKKDDVGYVVFYPLGTNKVNVPTSSSEWPKGDTLVSPFVYQDKKLVGFVDTKALTVSSNTTIYFPYTHIEADFPEIEKGQLQIHAPNAITKKASWKKTGKEDIPEAQFKYKGCKTIDNVKSVNADYQTTDIVNGVWTEPLWDLEQGGDGEWYGGMFYNCVALTSFNSDLSSLTDGSYMFRECSQLTTFSSDLSSLTDCIGMFEFCKLDAHSVANIVHTLPTHETSGEITIGMGCNDTTEDKDLFAQEVGYSDMTSLLSALQAKGWNVTVQYNGRPTTTYSLRKPSEDTLPIFVKIEEDEKHGRYTSEDGSKKFRLNYFHETTGSTNGYTQFNSLEEAIQHFNIKPIEK